MDAYLHIFAVYGRVEYAQLILLLWRHFESKRCQKCAYFWGASLQLGKSSKLVKNLNFFASRNVNLIYQYLWLIFYSLWLGVEDSQVPFVNEAFSGFQMRLRIEFDVTSLFCKLEFS